MAFSKEANIRKRKSIYDKTNGLCIYCGCNLNIENFNMEHVIPKSVKSGNSRERLFPSCQSCNSFKHNLTIDEFREKIENELFNSFHVNMVQKYHNVEKKKVVFYFEKVGIDIYGR